MWEQLAIELESDQGFLGALDQLEADDFAREDGCGIAPSLHLRLAAKSPQTKPFFLGIDGGATSCRARIRDIDGSLSARAKVARLIFIQIYDSPAMELIRLACEAALRSAALGEQTLGTRLGRCGH